MTESKLSASHEMVTTGFARYNEAVTGFREYWYPVMFSRHVGKKPITRRFLGDPILFVREKGTLYALNDRCPHRGVPLSVDPRREFPGTLSCGYHGWTYDLASGDLVAAITDGPDSPICGKVKVQTYPIVERAGLVWIFMGEGDPPPVEDDIPEDLLRPDAVIEGIFQVRPGNWRYGIENGIDEGHAKFLHRTTPWMFFRELPTWTKITMEHSEDRKWLVRTPHEVGFETDFPGLGKWPKQHVGPIKTFWKARNRNAQEVRIRMPGLLRVLQHGWVDFEMYIPVDEDTHMAMLLAVRFTKGLGPLFWRLRYWSYIRWIFQTLLNGRQDGYLVRNMNTPPERLYRPDVSITAWRTMCHEHARDPQPKVSGKRPKVSGLPTGGCRGSGDVDSRHVTPARAGDGDLDPDSSIHRCGRP